MVCGTIFSPLYLAARLSVQATALGHKVRSSTFFSLFIRQKNHISMPKRGKNCSFRGFFSAPSLCVTILMCHLIKLLRPDLKFLMFYSCRVIRSVSLSFHSKGFCKETVCSATVCASSGGNSIVLLYKLNREMSIFGPGYISF